MLTSNGPSLARTLASLLLMGSLVFFGCTHTQSTTTAPADEASPATSDGSSTLSQTGARAPEEGAPMPLNRSVSLIDAPGAPVAVSGQSSQAFANRIIADSAGTSIPNIDARVDSVLALMTLEEKVGQMMQLELGMATNRDTYPQTINEEKLRRVIREYHVGSLLNVVNAAFTLDHWRSLMTKIQAEAAQTRLGIPVLYGIDAVHGANYTREAVLFPQNQGLAATWNLPLATRAAEITAHDVRASGIPWNFAPVLDVGRDPRWPRLYETLGEDAHLTTAMGLALIRGLQGDDLSARTNVAATMKHFIGYSGPESGRDRTPARISDIELREHYLPPFRAAVEAGAASVMVNSGEVNGVPVHSSHYLLTEVLRNELGFEGLVVSDWLDIKKLVSLHHVAANEREATKMAIQAGVDMSMVPSDVSFFHHLTDLVRDGEISEARINASVRRILRLKFALGLFADPLRGLSLADSAGTATDRRVALQAARESITLLRNTNNVLPLQPDQRVLVTGPTAHSMQALNNGWTYTWQGGGRAQSFFHSDRPTLMEAIKGRSREKHVSYVPGSTLTQPDRMAQAVAEARASDVVVVALGEGAYAETAGNLESLMLPDAQRALLQKIEATGTPVVLVLVQGRPRTLGNSHEGVEGIIAAHNPGTEGGQALAEVLYGDVNPSGHLPYTYPNQPTGYALYDHKTSEQLAANFGNEGANPLFPFGFGASYTTFTYSDLKLSAPAASLDAIQNGRAVSAEVTVTNTGARAGKDVVQLYMRDVVASVTPAVRRLKRFAKVDLAPGESKTLTFALTAKDFSFIGRDAQPTIEPGRFIIQVDSLQTEFTIEKHSLQTSQAVR
ncbi:glycoside hydrolase family 3 N-terminal domain-containing protein [Salisaeta longa]|uniref:glycoside hydrolase family 3 N-terminal domain-containing protein n=1 Tax=Salisaeta longa TaxID=503170 RepID=UPI0003B79E2E|nr:glycoside hydrolase family 3 N-terminal domain-containing protein [Salisaeta longa]